MRRADLEPGRIVRASHLLGRDAAPLRWLRR
jgi:hypothetical protein